MSIQAIKSIVEHQGELCHMNINYSSVQNTDLSFQHIQSMVSLHGRSFRVHLQLNYSKNSLNSRFFHDAIHTLENDQLSSWIMLQFIFLKYDPMSFIMLIGSGIQIFALQWRLNSN